MSKVDELIEYLSDLEFHCSICINKEIASGQLAKVAQNMRDNGYQMYKEKHYGKSMFCPECGRNTLHYKLLSLEKTEKKNVRDGFSKSQVDRIKKIYNNVDAFDLHYSNDLEIDHRITPYIKEEYKISDDSSDEEIKNEYQCLTKRNNDIKREICKKCQETRLRGIYSGIDFFYVGNEKYEGSCEGCFYAYPDKWRKSLNELYRK